MALNSQAQLAVVSKERHALKKWQRANGYSFAARQAVVPIVAAEMASASHAMPLAFVQDNDRFSLVGLLSVAPGTNLFVGPSGQWLGSYVPAAFRSYPFRMVRAEGSDGLMLAVDETSGVVVENDFAW